MHKVWKLFKWSLLITLIFSLLACAYQILPTGGPKDATPPEVVNTVPANQATNYLDHFVTIQFSEFLNAPPASNRIFVSPASVHVTDVKLRGKKVVINLNRACPPDTTCVLTIVNGIADYTEQNVLPIFNLTFTANNTIDSTSLNGKVLDAFTLKPVKNALVALYNDANFTNQTIYNSKPEYILLTDNNGAFTFNSLKPSTYRVFAFFDNNFNYTYDALEPLAFFNEPTVLNNTSLQLDALMLPVLDNKNQYVKQFNCYNGREFHVTLATEVDSLCSAQLLGNNAHLSLKTVLMPENQVVFWCDSAITTDSIYLKITAPTAQNPNCIVGATDFVDTLLFVSHNNLLFDNTLAAYYAFAIDTTNISENKLVISFAEPLDSLNKLKLHLLQQNSSKQYAQVPINLSYHKPTNKLTIKPSNGFNSNTNYQLKIDSAAFINWYAAANKLDSISFVSPKIIATGNLVIDLQAVLADGFVQLVSEKDDLVVQQQTVTGNTLLQFNNLTQQNYYLRFVVDSNNNNKWDAGCWQTKTQPETVRYFPKPIKIRANWSLKERWIMQ